MKRGYVHGATDETGERVAEHAVTMPDFNATIAHALALTARKSSIPPPGGRSRSQTRASRYGSCFRDRLPTRKVNRRSRTGSPDQPSSEPVANLRQRGIPEAPRFTSIHPQSETLFAPEPATCNQLDFDGGRRFVVLD